MTPAQSYAENHFFRVDLAGTVRSVRCLDPLLLWRSCSSFFLVSFSFFLVFF